MGYYEQLNCGTHADHIIIDCLRHGFCIISIQMDHEPHIAKPKIAKNANSKLPEAFRMQAATSKRSSEPFEEPKSHVHSQPKHDIRDMQKQQIKKERKSKNPFLPVKQFMRKADEFSREMKEANSDFNIDRLYKYSYQGDSKQRMKFKYENCITLSIVRKTAAWCLKKVLHVPTLSLHFLRESLISTHFDKNELNEWISVVNQKEGENCIKIIEIFWNMPENYYSLLYEYSQGLLLDSLNESLHTLPIGLLRDIAVAHLSNSIGIYNSQLILFQQKGSKRIKYISSYEETDFLLGSSKKVLEIIESQRDQSNIQTKFIWKLGLLLLNGYFGSVILAQDLEKVVLPLKKCCLLHEILGVNTSLCAIYLSISYNQDESFIQFLCKCLRSKKQSEKQVKVQLKSLRNHRFTEKRYNQIVSLGELIDVVDPCSNVKSKFQMTKMNKIIDSINLILQNVGEIKTSISSESKDIILLAKQLGMAKQIQKFVGELKKVYRE